MDLIEHLIAEHREAEGMLAQLKDTEPGSERDQLTDQLADALRTHMAVEERFLYPIVTETLGAEPKEEAEVEHELARDALVKLTLVRAKPGFGAAVDMLEAGIAHHVHEEESEMFPKLRESAKAQIEQLDPNECKAAVENDPVDLTKEELYRRAQDADIPGRSSMTKEQLAESLADK